MSNLRRPDQEPPNYDATTDQPPYVPPRWTIDLSLAPRDRYREIARHYKHQVQDLTVLYEELLRDVLIPEKLIPTITRVSKLLLRKLHDKSQTEELIGIFEESGVPMYLLVAFNVILDLLMGCTSGGVKSLEKGQPLSEAKMLHFRTLDWTMNPLRKVVVQLDFVRSKSGDPQCVLASSITYVGFTGVLTGVRPGLSLSLNFRAVHDKSSRAAHFRFYFHHILVLLGKRPSIATYLRSYLIGQYDGQDILASKRKKGKKDDLELTEISQPKALPEIYEELRQRHSTAAYLIFCDGNTTISIDKDFKTAKLRQSQNFIATTNHDVIEHNVEQKESNIVAKAVQSAPRLGFDEFLEESEDRLKCISTRWSRLVTRRHKDQTGIRGAKTASLEEVAATTTLTKKQVVEWLLKYPTSNECTHYNVVLDAKSGSVVFSTAYPEPIEEDFRIQVDL